MCIQTHRNVMWIDECRVAGKMVWYHLEGTSSTALESVNQFSEHHRATLQRDTFQSLASSI